MGSWDGLFQTRSLHFHRILSHFLSICLSGLFIFYVFYRIFCQNHVMKKLHQRFQDFFRALKKSRKHEKFYVKCREGRIFVIITWLKDFKLTFVSLREDTNLEFFPMIFGDTLTAIFLWKVEFSFFGLFQYSSNRWQDRTP